MQCINGVDEWRPALPEGYFGGPFGGPIFESRTVSADCTAKRQGRAGAVLEWLTRADEGQWWKKEAKLMWGLP